jgi:(p)ppGpp synthase/HD superfamily hydrolase
MEKVEANESRPSIVNNEYSSPPSLLSFLKSGSNLSLSSFHEEKVTALWKSLKTRGSIRLISHIDAKQVILAIRIAYVAFWGKKTKKSLEVLIGRAIGTAAVLGELRATTEVVIAGILHDIFFERRSVKYTELLRSLLVPLFGDEPMQLVAAYTSLPNFMARKTQYSAVQSENQVQMLAALAEDYLVLYIRLADRLHNLRVLRSLHIDDMERGKIAQEALHVYAVRLR